MCPGKCPWVKDKKPHFDTFRDMFNNHIYTCGKASAFEWCLDTSDGTERNIP